MESKKMVRGMIQTCERVMVLRLRCVVMLCVVMLLQLPACVFSNIDSVVLKRRDQSEEGKRFYQIRRVFPSSEKDRFTIVLVTLDPTHFNRADMKTLACRLNREFPQVTRLKAGLLDDENVARLFVTGALEMPEFDKAQRGLYYLDRAKRKEYIQFSTKRGRPKNEVTIRLNCY